MKLQGTHLVISVEECDNLRDIFIKLMYPNNLISTVITTLINKVVPNNEQNTLAQLNEKIVRIVIPFRDQKSANNADLS